MVRISVAMATYNGGNYIEEQLRSVLTQLGKEDEIVISDDGSNDGTIGIIKGFADSRIRLYEGGFKDYLKNFDHALSKCNGRFVFLCDQDDIWEPGKVQVMLKYLDSHNMVVSDCTVVDNELNVIQESFYQQRHSGQGFVKNLISNSYLGCCMAFRKEVLSAALPFPKRVYSHDTWIGLIAELMGNPIFIKDKLIKYRRHGNNASWASEKSRNGVFMKSKIRFHLIKGLTGRYQKIRSLRTAPEA